MPDIRYVCLSDMHLGEEDSLLTNLKTASTDPDPSEASPVMKSLVECLRELISQNSDKSKKPVLILNGDILELALTTDNQAAMVFERFAELIMPSGGELFDKIIYIPGNHDHHLWESARETQYVNYIKGLKPGDNLKVPWHATNMFLKEGAGLVPIYLLTNLLQRYEHLKNILINAAYPNLGILAKDNRKCVIFHHGHFIESLYQLISIFKNMIFPDRQIPQHVWDLEAENFAWIDFFWSTMGRSGEAGHDIELIYEKMQDKERFKKLLSSLAHSLAEKYDLPGWGNKMEETFLQWAFDFLADRAFRTERTLTERLLSPEAEKGLWWYMNKPLRNQVMLETNDNMPADVTFVFGHTHKPFQEDMNFKGYPQWVNVYNSGGWIVETVDPQPLHGGAVILVDENLNTASLRMYNEQNDQSEYKVSVQEATHAGEQSNPLYQRVITSVDPSKEPWSTFSSTVARAVWVRAQNLRARINEKG